MSRLGCWESRECFNLSAKLDRRRELRLKKKGQSTLFLKKREEGKKKKENTPRQICVDNDKSVKIQAELNLKTLRVNREGLRLGVNKVTLCEQSNTVGLVDIF